MSGRVNTKRALVIGGTRGIGAAVTDTLIDRGWAVTATGREHFNLGQPTTWEAWRNILPGESAFGLVVFCAGVLDPEPWSSKSWDAYARSYVVHALGPVRFLARYKDDLFPWWTRVVFVSSVGAVNAGAVDLGYGMAKAALEKAARALAEHESWRITLVRLDLVDTGMLRQLPVDSLHGRAVLTPGEAAGDILRQAQVPGQY